MTVEENNLNFCANHPNRETGLRCNRCEKPICASCAKRTPTGYRCPECLREQRKVFDTALPQDYLFAFLAAVLLSVVGTLVARMLWIFFIIFLGPFSGELISRVVRRIVQRRRSKPLFMSVIVGIVAGGLFILWRQYGPLLMALDMPGAPEALLASSFNLLSVGLYLFLSASTAYARLAGIRIG